MIQSKYYEQMKRGIMSWLQKAKLNRVDKLFVEYRLISEDFPLRLVRDLAAKFFILYIRRERDFFPEMNRNILTS